MKNLLLFVLLLIIVFSVSCCFKDVEVTFINKDDLLVQSIQYKDHNSTAWHTNILDSNLTSGDSFTSFFEKGVYDFMFVFSNQVILIDRDVNLENIEIATIDISRVNL
jgi:hypothetical protein